jgi:penicillin-binding protein 1C
VIRRNLALVAVLATIIIMISLALFTARAFKRPLIDARVGSRQILDRNGQLLRLTLAGDERYRLFTPLSEMPNEAIEAILLHEDHYFRYHPGVNPWSLTKALVSTYARGGRRMGGSTITMQLARLTSTHGSKTISGKLYQIARAFYLESLYSKDEILEAYMNLLPYGGNVEGLGTASLVYFEKPPKDLTVPEILTLTLIPQNPNLRQLSNQSEAFERSRKRFAHAWLVRHPEDKVSIISLDLPFQIRKFSDLPFEAPHFVNSVLEKTGGPEFTRTSRIQTTLDLAIQKQVESKLKAYIKSESFRGIKNGTAMVVDTRTMDIVAMVGSANFFDEDIEGQVNGTLAKRSPGSALKPFVYGLALDQGLIHPLTLLKDTPMSFGGFDPENFDRRFAGPVSATEALITSRNVPAVYLASQLSSPSFYDFLKSSGVTRMKEAKFYGLALPLGGGEVTMVELLRLYSMLANYGELRQLRSLSHEPAQTSKRLLSKEASFLVLDMLRQNPRDDQKFVDGLLRDAVPTAWKTGTSYGFRDAWTAGVVGPYAIAVWLGNFNGDENQALVGRELAAPLFFSIVDGLKSKLNGPAKWLETRDLDIKKVRVCALSGQFENKNCKHGVETWFIPGKSPIGECTVHREVALDAQNRRACDESKVTHKEVFEFWPSDLLQVFRLAGLSRKTPPPFASDCGSEATELLGQKPMITSPRTEVSYRVRMGATRDVVGEDRIPFMAVSDADAHVMHWFVGAEYVGKSSPEKPFLWKPRIGRFIVRVVDDLGRTDSRDLVVAASR